MSSAFPIQVIDFLLPQLALAGQYTVEIQKRVRAHDAKPGSTPFHQALSDADLSVQAFLEVALLARFPEISFFSEEQAQSLNQKYFPERARFELLLDPVDGTRFYLDSREGYQIIVTLLDGDEIVAAVF